MARAAVLVAAVCALASAACTGDQQPAAWRTHPSGGQSYVGQPGASGRPSGGSPRRPASSPPVAGAHYAAGGCATTSLLLGASPAWARPARPPAIRYALADAGRAAAYLFGYPLRAGSPQDPDDKILWIMRRPRDGQPLRLAGRLLGAAAAQTVSSTWPADSSPGEIYPSIVNVPVPGCWRFTLTWNGHQDSVDLRYLARR